MKKPFVRKGRGLHDGPVGWCGEELAHYPLTKDGAHLDKRRGKLIWIAEGEGGHYEYAQKGERGHLARYHTNEVELGVGD